MYFIFLARVIFIVTTIAARDVLDLMSQRADRLSTFLSLLTETGLASELSEGTFTLFAPSNEAFEDVTLPVAMDDVRNLLEYHFVPDSKVTTDSFWDDDQLETFGGNGTLRLKVYRKVCLTVPCQSETYFGFCSHFAGTGFLHPLCSG